MRINYFHIVISLILLVSTVSCLNSDCSTNYIRQSCSPARTVQACCYFTDCGATTGGPFTISLIEGCDSIPDLKNSIYLFTHDNPVNFSWTANDSLKIEYNGEPLDIDFKNNIKLEKSNQTINITYLKK